MFAFGFCETACLRGLQGTAKERIGDMNKDEELELKVKMFCAAINSTVYEGSVGRIRAITEEVNIAFEMLKKNTSKC